MKRSKPIKFLAAVALVPLATLTVAACSNGSVAAVPAPTQPRTSSGAPAAVGVAKIGLGNVLVDSQGRTVYLFTADTGAMSTCSGACAVAWLPVRASGKPTVGSGVNPSLVGSTDRSDGKRQVTYNGHPLYLYSGDQKPGGTSGQGVNGFGARWFMLAPGGSQISLQLSGGSGGVYGMPSAPS